MTPFIYLFIGYSNNKLLMAADNNRNNSIADDSVYPVVLRKYDPESNDFRNSLPFVKVDSVLVDHEGGVKTFESIFMRFAPIPSMNGIFADSAQAEKTDRMYIALYDGGRYTGSFMYKEKSYVIFISPHAVASRFYPIENSETTFASIAVARCITTDSGTITKGRYIGILEQVQQGKRRAIFDSLELKIVKADIRNKHLTIRIDSISGLQKKIAVERLKRGSFYSLNQDKNISLDFTKTQFTIIEFTGSWCAACMYIMPRVKELQKKLPSSFHFISIDTESSLELAKKHYKSSEISFESIYEKTNCKLDSCLQKQFEVEVFPAFFIIDRAGNVVWRKSGSNAIDEIPPVIQMLSNNKASAVAIN